MPHTPNATDSLRAITGPRWIALLIVMLSSGPPLIALTFSTIAPVLPAIGKHFGSDTGSTFFAQWIMTAPALGLMLGGALSGFLIDKIGPRFLIITALCLFALGGSAGLYLDDPVAMLFSRFLLGLGGSSAATTATWLVGERFDELARRKLIGIQDACAGIAAMSALLLSGMLGAHIGWRMPFAIYLVAVPIALLARLSVPQIKTASTREDSATTGTMFSALWPIYAIVLAMAGLMMMPATQVSFLLDSHGISDPIIKSRVIASSAATSIVAAALYARVRGLLGERGTLSAILLAFALGTVMLSQSGGVWDTAFGCMLLGCGTGLFAPHFASVIIGRTPHNMRGRALGFMFSAMFLSEFVSPVIILPLRTAFGQQGAFLAISAALFTAFIIAVLQRQRLPVSPVHERSNHE